MPTVSDFTLQNRLHAKNTKAALAEGFLDNIGSSQDFSQPIAFDALELVMLESGEKFVKAFAEELAAGDINAGGGLTDSIRFEYTKAGQVYTTNVYMSDYAKFVDEGVQGVSPSLNQNRTSPYHFKYARPSASHVAALERWIREKNITAVVTVPKGIQGVANSKSLAEAMGYAIKRRGLKATYFKRKVVERLVNDFKAAAAKAMSDDITVNIIL